MSQRFPMVERIDPFLKLGTLRVDFYNVVAEPGQYFNAKHKKAIEEALRNRIDKVRQLTIKNGTVEAKAMLRVIVEPSDSIGSKSFVVHDTLCEMLRPKVPFVAIAAVRPAVYAQGNFMVGIQILGDPSDETIERLELRILATPYSEAVQRDAEEPACLNVTLGGPWSTELLDEYRKMLIKHAGIACTVMVNTKR